MEIPAYQINFNVLFLLREVEQGRAISLKQSKRETKQMAAVERERDWVSVSLETGSRQLTFNGSHQVRHLLRHKLQVQLPHLLQQLEQLSKLNKELVHFSRHTREHLRSWEACTLPPSSLQCHRLASWGIQWEVSSNCNVHVYLCVVRIYRIMFIVYDVHVH